MVIPPGFGKLNVFVLLRMAEIVGLVNVLFVNVCTAVRTTAVSVISGKVIVLLAVASPLMV